MNKRTWNSIIVATVFGIFAACANTSGGGESETNWLKTCTTNADCSVGSCLCNVCTIACTPGGSCASGPPESECVASASANECSGVSDAPRGVCLAPREAGAGTGGAGAGTGGHGTGGRSTGGTGGSGGGNDTGGVPTGGAGTGGALDTTDGGSTSVETGGGPGSGNTGGRSSRDGGNDAADAGCVFPRAWIYTEPGCDKGPVCAIPDGDSCLSIACDCNGKQITGGCFYYYQPFRHGNECTDADVPPVIGPLDASTLP